MIATFASRLMGFARNAVVGALFGQTWKADVLNTVFSIPFNLRKLVAEGALSSAFIPVLSKSVVDDPSLQKSRDLTRGIITFQLLLLIPLTALCILFAEPIVSVLAPFPDPVKQAFAVDLFRWFINYLLLVSIAAVLMAVLNVHQKFAVPAISPVIFSFSVIASLLAFYPTMGIYAQVPGVLVGGICQVLFQWFAARRLGYSLKPKVKFWTPELKDTVKKWAPALSISGIALLNQQISMSLAATLTEGSASALSNAIIFWQLPAGVLSASVITVFFARMSRQVAEQDWQGASVTMTRGLELQALLLIPAGFFLALFGEPVIALAFQRGNYTYADSVLASSVLFYMSFGLFLSGMFNFLQRFFFAKNDFRTPFWVNVVWAVTDVSVSVTLMLTPLGVKGLALGGVAGFLAGSVCLLVLAWRGLPKRELVLFGWVLLRILIALVPVWFAVQAVHGWLGVWWKDGMHWASLGLLLAEGFGALGLLYLCLLAVGLNPKKLMKNRRA